jgi:hypothetical protein
MARENRDLGLSSDPGCTVQPRARDRAQHDCRYSAAARNRAGPGAEAKDNLEGVPKPSLGTDRGRRLPYRGSVDTARSAAVRSVILDRFVAAQARGGRNCATVDGFWMDLIGRSLTDSVDGILNGPYRKSHLAANWAGTRSTFRCELGTIPDPTGEVCPVASV